MQNDPLPVDELRRHVGALVAAESAPEVFKALIEALRLGAPRMAVFLVRQDQVKGWSSFGHPAEAASRLQGFTAPLRDGRLGRIAAADGPVVDRPAAADPDFGQAAADESIGVAVRVKDKPIAVLLSERTGDEAPWCPEIIGLLVSVAQLRLELALAMKKLATAVDRAAPRAPEAPRDAPTVREEPQAPVEESAVVEVDRAAAGQAAPQLEAAKRFAKLVATDIRLYNEEAVVLGRQNGDLSDRLGDSLARGKETFLRRHGELGPTALELLREAYVQVLAAGDGSLIPSSVLD